MCLRTRGAFVFSGAAETHSRAEAAAGSTLEACGSMCHRARPDSWGNERWGHTQCQTLIKGTQKWLGMTTFGYLWLHFCWRQYLMHHLPHECSVYLAFRVYALWRSNYVMRHEFYWSLCAVQKLLAEDFNFKIAVRQYRQCSIKLEELKLPNAVILKTRVFPLEANSIWWNDRIVEMFEISQRSHNPLVHE